MADQREASPPDDTLRLVTLGDTRLIACAADPGPGLVPQGKALSLLTYLHCAPRRSAPRDHLIDLLWSNAGGASGRQSLRQVVYRLRNTLGAAALDADRDSITLRLPLICDRDAFLAAARVGDHARATELYTGAFFPGFAAPGAVGFEQWVDLERTHLQASFLRAAEAAIGGAIDHGDPAAGARLATRVLELVPSAQAAWRLLIRSQAAAGRPSEALATADRLDSLLAADDTAPEAETRQLLARLRSLPGRDPIEPAPRRQPDLLGREPVFASLLASWRASTGGRGQVVTVHGAAGIGKTRLLQDFHERLGSLGATVLTVRARPAERDIPYAFAATMADTIAGLPGALGVSPSAAGVLVELDPRLSSRFRHTQQGSPRDPEEWLRVRSLALHELLQVTTEDSPLVLLVDDLHWADDASRQVLSAVAGRLGELPVLLVAGFRPMRPGWAVSDGTIDAELDPLSSEECEAMVASIASGEPGLCAELGRLIHQTSGGVPLLALAALDVALARGVLRLEEDRWIADDVEALRGVLTGGNLLEQLLANLPARAVQVLTALALAGQALDERVLSAASTTPDIGSLTGMLEQRGLLLRIGARWEVAHDRLADAALAIAPDGETGAVARRAGHALLSHPDPDAASLRLAGRLLLRGGDRAASVAFRWWLRAVNRRRYWQDPKAAAREFLGDLGTPQAVRTLVGRVSPVQRLVRGWPGPTALVAFFLVVVAVGSIRQPMLTWLEHPASTIRVSEPPSSRGFLFDADTQGEGNLARARNPVPIVVTFLDEEGAATRRAPRMAEVRVISGDSVWLEGTVSRPVQWGRAEFDDLIVGGGGAFHLEVHAGALPPVQTGRIFAGADGGGAHASMRILSGEVNGQRVDSVSRVIRVRAGTEIGGQLSFEAVTTARTAAVLMGAVAMWGDRTTNFMPLEALPPHGVTKFTTEIRDAHSRRRFQAPTAPGRYQILFLSDTETEMRYIASGTNWIVGQPAWFDGNDLQDLSADQLALIASGGRVLRPKLYVMPGDSGGTRIMDGTLAGAVLEIIVEP